MSTTKTDHRITCPECRSATWSLGGEIEPHGCKADLATVEVEPCERCAGSGYEGRVTGGHFAEDCRECDGDGVVAHVLDLATAKLERLRRLDPDSFDEHAYLIARGEL